MTVRPRVHGKSAFSRDAWLEIDLNAIEHNYQIIHEELQKDVKLMAVVKSDAYGHGASTVGPLLEACGTDYFGVASVDEGMQLREAGVSKPILILSPTPTWALQRALTNKLQVTISNVEQLTDLEKLVKRSKKFELPVEVQVKINTGMNRNGAKWNTEAIPLIKEVLSKKEFLKLSGVFSHFACSGNSFFTHVQADRFRKVISEFDGQDIGLRHIAASSGMVGQFANHFDMVRVGLSIYGLGEEFNGKLKPALSLMARISQLQKIEADEGVGYGLTWKCEKESLIGLLPLGYADGVKRGLSNRLRAIYKGEYIDGVGTISMDQITINLSNFVDHSQAGDKVTLLGYDAGKSIEIKEWAQILGTIEYEIVCDLRARLPRVYVRK